MFSPSSKITQKSKEISQSPTKAFSSHRGSDKLHFHPKAGQDGGQEPSNFEKKVENYYSIDKRSNDLHNKLQLTQKSKEEKVRKSSKISLSSRQKKP